MKTKIDLTENERLSLIFFLEQFVPQHLENISTLSKIAHRNILKKLRRKKNSSEVG